MSGASRDAKGQPGFVPVALFGLCPRCGARTLFAAAARFAPRCRACGLEFARFDGGDRLAAFLSLLIGTLVAGLAIGLETWLRPPLWVHVLVWVPVTVLAVIRGLRAGKAALLAARYRRGADEGGLGVP